VTPIFRPNSEPEIGFVVLATNVTAKGR
jgi:hypothetical protein